MITIYTSFEAPATTQNRVYFAHRLLAPSAAALCANKMETGTSSPPSPSVHSPSVHSPSVHINVNIWFYHFN